MWYCTKYKGGTPMNELLVDRLKSARIASGLKQQDVAEKMGVTEIGRASCRERVCQYV